MKRNGKKNSKTIRNIGAFFAASLLTAGGFVMGYLTGEANGERKKVEKEIDELKPTSGRYPWREEETDEDECDET